MNETLKTLKTRRSVRQYDPRPVEREKLEAILEAGTYAPSAMGRQSVTMAVLTKKEDIAELSALNAAVMDSSGDPFYGAPCVVVVLADPAATNAANAQRDGSLTMGNLMNAAWSLGVSSCWINRAEEVFAQPGARPCSAAGVCRRRWLASATASWATPQAISPPPSRGKRTS